MHGKERQEQMLLVEKKSLSRAKVMAVSATKSPCLYCKEREPNCHSFCLEYIL